MSVIESPRTTGSAQSVLPDAATTTAPTASPDTAELSDEQFARLFKQGFVFGTPVLYAIVAGVCTLAAPGHGWLLLAAAWPALLAGWYFGGIVALTVYELREARRRRQRMASGVEARRRAPLTAPATAH